MYTVKIQVEDLQEARAIVRALSEAEENGKLEFSFGVLIEQERIPMINVYAKMEDK